MDVTTKYSLVCVFLGLLSLYLISGFVELPFIPLNKINKSHLNEVVKTSGTIERIYLSNFSTLFLNLKKKGDILKVVKFNVESTNLKKNDFVEVEGEVTLYQNKLEIVARSISKIN